MSESALSRRALFRLERAARPGGWRGWALSLLVVALLLVLLEGGYRWLESRSQAPLFRVIVAGESLTLDDETHADFSRDLTALTAEIQAQLAARMTPWMDARLDSAFEPLAAAVPGYLDWYFSAPGSYLRLGVATVGDLDEWLDEQLHERLIAPSGIEAALAELLADYPERLAREQRALADGLAATLHERYAPRQVAAATSEEVEMTAMLDLDAVLLSSLNDGLDRSRWSAAALGGAGVGLMASRTLVGRLGAGAAVQASRMALRGLVVRLGAGTARSLASGGVAAMATSPTGPGALVVGTLTGAATLAAIAGGEYALLKSQESRHRPAMEEQMHEALAETRASLGLALEATAADAARAIKDRLGHAGAPEETAGGKPAAFRILGRQGEKSAGFLPPSNTVGLQSAHVNRNP